jgi:general secretion pathway protein L
MQHGHLGLDIGTGSVKAALVAGTSKGFEIIDVFEEVIEPGDELGWQERAQAALSRLGGRLKADTSAVAIPPMAAVLTYLKLPLDDPKKIASTIGYELESSMPYEVGDVVYDYRILNKGVDGTELSVSYTPKKEVASTLSMLSAAQVDPRYLFSPAQSLRFASMLMDPARSGDGPYMIVDAGAKYALLCVVDESDIPVSRAVRLSSDLPGTGEAGAAQLVESTAADLAESIMLLASSYSNRTRREVQSVFICGGRSLLPGICERLTEILQTRCETLSQNSALELESEKTARFALAIAMAAESATALKRQLINFRRDDFSFRGEYKFLRGKLIQIGVAIGIIVSLALTNTVIGFRTLSTHEEQLDSRLQEVTKQLLGKPYDDYTIALSIMKQKISPQASPIPKVTALDYFIDVSVRLPKEVQLDLREINIQSNKIRIEGDTDSFEGVDKIVNGLKTNKCFDDINKGRVKKSIDGAKVEFDLTITPKC